MRRRSFWYVLGTCCCLLGTMVQAEPFQPAVRAPADASPLGGASIFGDAPLPFSQAGKVVLPPVVTPTTNLEGIGTGVLPDDLAAAGMSESRALPEGPDRPQALMMTSYAWQASNTFSHPLYFEDIMLERHGHQFPYNTPLVSGARFFFTFPALPYLMTIDPPASQVYTLGHWRSGSRAPCLFQRPPYQRDAAIVEGAAIATGIIALP